ncbi:MAG: DUF58 domain-containing protein [Butyrivibrio sp.]|uniref:DUF58 domain-containing protein n=1 Tax=Butyrivibrio sp. TaxID=28121 RepID=UPI0025F48867|nr:DUF58 domain-containing protein [Butyrivibrio sp.]MCR5769792.1 DUF58 domain-containing protein [Butyrivibrio sp.]
MQIILIIPIVFILYYLYRTYFGRNWSDNLSATLSFGSNIVEGNDTELKEVISNRKWLGIPFLEVRFQVGKGLEVENGQNVTVSDRTNITDIFSLKKYEKITRTLPVHGQKRGYYEVLSTSLVGYDMIGGVEHYTLRDQNTSLYVFPKTLSSDRFDVSFSKMLGDIVTRRFLQEDVFTFRGIRDYTTQDTVSSINWKATAASGDFKVNLHDPTSSQEIVLILNVEDPSVLYDSDLIEDSIRLIMSLTSFFISKQIPVRLISNGKDIITSEEIRISSGNSDDHRHRIAMDLARIDLTKSVRPMSEIFEELIIPSAKLRADQTDVTYMLVSSCQRDDIIKAAGELADINGSLIWLCPLTPSMEERVPEGKIHFYKIKHE